MRAASSSAGVEALVGVTSDPSRGDIGGVAVELYKASAARVLRSRRARRRVAAGLRILPELVEVVIVHPEGAGVVGRLRLRHAGCS
jgi:hypothetical protein